MPTIHLTTFIAAPVERVFDLSRSIDLHKKSMLHTKEEAVAGTTTGLINLHDTVTWKGRHLGKTRFFKSRITALEKPFRFSDEMAEGDFKSFVHEHHFKQVDNGTIMIDIIHFEAPYRSLGKLFSKLYLTNYMRRMIESRNQVIKDYAESDKWKNLINAG
ncbi:MAG TPA: SRPBCC family protein [Chitinophagaceae bacterium]|nr:SRPBCC family protein [Chitinophagaceae bacterium]